MTEKFKLSRPLVVGHKRDGRSCYDREAKRELVQACLQPGVSVARLALEYGVNANLLRKWIDRYRGEFVGEASALSAFIPGVAAPVEKSAGLRLVIRFDNGVQADLAQLSREDVLAILPVLSCSDLTRR